MALYVESPADICEAYDAYGKARTGSNRLPFQCHPNKYNATVSRMARCRRAAEAAIIECAREIVEDDDGEHDRIIPHLEKGGPLSSRPKLCAELRQIADWIIKNCVVDYSHAGAEVTVGEPAERRRDWPR